MKHINDIEWDVDDGDEVEYQSVPVGRGFETGPPRNQVCVAGVGGAFVLSGEARWVNVWLPNDHFDPSEKVIARPGVVWTDTERDS